MSKFVSIGTNIQILSSVNLYYLNTNIRLHAFLFINKDCYDASGVYQYGGGHLPTREVVAPTKVIYSPRGCCL